MILKNKKYIIFDLDGTLINSTHKIIDIIEKFFLENYPDYYDNAKYYIENNQWQSLQEQLEKIFNDKEIAIKITKKLYKKLNNLRNKINFIPWIQEKIKQLSKNYRLFLSTGSSTDFANNTLKDWWIKNCFEIIYWSDKILKWKEHIDIFKNSTWDSDFYKNCVYVWDWEMDKIFAMESWIDFIRVWYKWEKDENKIISVKDIDNFIKL